MSEQGKDTNQDQYQQHHHNPDQHQPPAAQYGTFQGVHNYLPPPVIGFPQPVPPPGVSGNGHSVHPYVHGYQAVPGYAVAEGRPMRQDRLPCCGIGIGWFLFIVGFISAIPWYIGAFILICAKSDEREKPGYVACLIAAILGTIAIIFGVTGT